MHGIAANKDEVLTEAKNMIASRDPGQVSSILYAIGMERLRELHVHLRRLTKLSPYIVVFVMPGGFAMLPVLAWWLDRRRQRNRTAPPPTIPSGTASDQRIP